MAIVSSISSPVRVFYLYNKKPTTVSLSSSLYHHHYFQFEEVDKRAVDAGVVCYAHSVAPLLCELELAYVASLFVIIAPSEVIKFKSTEEGTIISLVIAGYLPFQHFTRAGSLKTAFEQGSIVATLALISILAVMFALDLKLIHGCMMYNN